MPREISRGPFSGSQLGQDTTATNVFNNLSPVVAQLPHCAHHAGLIPASIREAQLRSRWRAQLGGVNAGSGGDYTFAMEFATGGKE